jgi:hypothetical protein
LADAKMLGLWEHALFGCADQMRYAQAALAKFRDGRGDGEEI